MSWSPTGCFSPGSYCFSPGSYYAVLLATAESNASLHVVSATIIPALFLAFTCRTGRGWMPAACT